LFFWRNNAGNEIDLLIKKQGRRFPVEIKSGQTISEDYFKGIKYWEKMTKDEGGFLIYGGNMYQKRSHSITVIPLKNIDIINDV
jgi:predicted AAA+ superfamily ATPase